MANKSIITEGFDAFRRGSFENGGQNLYVSKNGVLQRVFQYDLNRNGYVDLVFANCQNHHEAAPSYVYTPSGERVSELPGQGSVAAMVLDIDGDGYNDIVVAGFYDMAAPYASSDIYFGSEEGYSEKYHIRIPTPNSTDCAYGDIIGCGKPQLIFAMPIYKKIRIFTQTERGLEWNEFQDYDIEAELVTLLDLDGDGYDDLVVKMVNKSTVTVYWGGEDGINLLRKTSITPCSDEEVIKPFTKETKQSAMEKIFPAPYLVKAVKWNNKNCFTFSNGKDVVFFTATKEREIIAELKIKAPFALSCAVGDLDGDGYDDIALACREWDDERVYQRSYIVWGGKDGLDKKTRTALKTLQACHAVIHNGALAIAESSNEPSYQNDILLFKNGNFDEPERFIGQDSRRVSLFTNPDGREYLFVHNHFSRSFIGFDETYIYYGDKDGYTPERREIVPSHCAVDALIADIDDDGYAELIVGNNSENSIHLDVGHHIHYFGKDGFDPKRSRTVRTDVGWGVCCGDIDRDGYLELITPCQHWKNIRIFRGCDNFETWYDLELPEKSSGRWPNLADINCDGWLDLVVPGGKGGAVIFWGSPEGFSKERTTILNTPMSINVTFADLTKNGYPDVIIGTHTETPKNGRLTDINPHHSFVHIYWNGPSGISESRKCVLRADAADSFAVADFNNDGWLDIFVGNYHGGKDRDINSFIYWNREGHFRELDRELLFTHSASGCLAADFNEDGYIDLAVANHKVDGDHKGYSTVWWNGKDGFNQAHQTNLPTSGPHGMISTNIGNVLNRSYNEHYISEVFDITDNCTIAGITLEAEIPQKTCVTATVRINGGEWVEPQGVKLLAGDKLEYRLCLYAYNCLRTPRITKVTVELE